MLFGEFFHNMDAKGRMNFPSRMRDELGDRFCVTLWSDNCLAVFSDNHSLILTPFSCSFLNVISFSGISVPLRTSNSKQSRSAFFLSSV